MPRNSLLPESGMRLPVKEILRACMLGSVVVGDATLGRSTDPGTEPPAPIIGMMKKVGGVDGGFRGLGVRPLLDPP